jgi:hypothetical protein
MSGRSSVELLGAIERQVSLLEGIFGAVEQAMEKDVTLIGRTANSAVMVAGLLDNYYTCLETAFVRISQYFENSLGPGKWHSELLEKMTLRMEGIRIPAVSRENYGNLVELMKFRHFRRYYFELQYDWHRIDFLVAKLRNAHPIVKQDMARFVHFLKGI